MNEFLFFKVVDPEWVHKLNNRWVRVRMNTDDTSVVYIFDDKTDTYLTFVKRELETADPHSTLDQHWSGINEHMDNLKQQADYRQAKYEEALAYVENEDRSEPDIPLHAESNLLITGVERPNYRDVDQPENEKTKSSSLPRKPVKLLPTSARVQGNNHRHEKQGIKGDISEATVSESGALKLEPIRQKTQPDAN